MTGGSYVPYVAVKTVSASEIPSEKTVTFTLTGAADEADIKGVAPDKIKAAVNTDIEIPANRTLYVEGKTLTGWTDGNTEYAVGSKLKLTADTTLTPVFKANEANIGDAETTVVFDFQRKNGAPTVAWEKRETPDIWVGQAAINGKTVDVKLEVDTTSGKLANGNWTDWAQANDGTVFKLYLTKGSAVTFDAQQDAGTLTITGKDPFTKSGSFTYDGEAGVADATASGLSYIRTITIKYPAAA